MSTTHFVDLRYVLGVTAATKAREQDGSVFVLVDLDVEHRGAESVFSALQSGSYQDSAEAVSRETISLELSVPQFYQLLSEFEEARAGLVKASEQI